MFSSLIYIDLGCFVRKSTYHHVVKVLYDYTKLNNNLSLTQSQRIVIYKHFHFHKSNPLTTANSLSFG
jgi:hypothetical protein